MVDWNIIFSGLCSGFQLITTIVTLLGIGGIIFVENKNLSKIFEQRPEILFGYYAKIKVYFFLIEKSLGNDNNTPLLQGVVDEMLKNDAYKPDINKINDMKENVSELFNFLKNENWQIPLDLEFEKNFEIFIEYLYEMKKIETCKLYNDINSAVEKRKEILDIISNLKRKIQKEQEKLVGNSTEQ